MQQIHDIMKKSQFGGFVKKYLVGGAVRDGLLSIPVQDRDWVVVGATPEQMLEQGYVQVGKDFPVFLHPDSKEEYALARKERKSGHGYGGFEVDFSTTVTLVEDLSRRDLTINAIAQDLTNGFYVDPYDGISDLTNGVLRHVSEAFSEDPLRVLRVARFAARYADLGFKVAPETMDLMKKLVDSGELNHLTPERVYKEFDKVFTDSTGRPSVFMRVLRDCGALKCILPEVDSLYGVPQNAEHHPEVDTGIHTEMVMDQAFKLAKERAPDLASEIVFAAMVHDLGKALTPSDEWPRHLKHEENGKIPVREVCERFKVPNNHSVLAELVCVEHLRMHRVLESRPGSLLNLLEQVGAFKNPKRLEAFMIACEADSRGRLGLEDRSYPQPELLREAYEAAAPIKAHRFVESGLKGPEVGEALRVERLKAITVVQKAWKVKLEKAEVPGVMLFSKPKAATP